VAFIGTNRPHKGIKQLRGAVAELAAVGFRLVITDAAPSDAREWEEWIGPTTLKRGLEIVHGCDIVATPSLRQPYAFGQVPVKLIDAMLAARPVVVSHVGPMPWAVGNGGILVKPGSQQSLVRALKRLADPSERERLGMLGRQLALDRYTVEAQRENFRAICEPYLVSDDRHAAV
jgi:glycosyltransferase involved in cell wall biosynthesis